MWMSRRAPQAERATCAGSADLLGSDGDVVRFGLPRVFFNRPHVAARVASVVVHRGVLTARGEMSPGLDEAPRAVVIGHPSSTVVPTSRSRYQGGRKSALNFSECQDEFAAGCWSQLAPDGPVIWASSRLKRSISAEASSALMAPLATLFSIVLMKSRVASSITPSSSARLAENS